MSITSTVQAVPRTAVETYFRAARLPVTAAQRIAGQRENAQWPLAVAFEAFEARVEGFVGSTLHDPVLADRARLRKAAVTQLRRAAELEATAVQERESAETALSAAQERAADEEAETERRAEQRQHDLERQADLHEQKIREKAAKKAAAASTAKARRDDEIAKRERVGRLEALAVESEALETSREALAAADTVDAIDSGIESSRAARAAD